MATVEQVLDALAHVRACTGDPTGGLTLADLAELSTTLPGGGIPEHLDALLAKIHRRYPTLFDPAGTPVPPPGTPQHQDGATTDAARDHEDALARQASSSAQLDLLVITAIRNAHQKNAESRDALARLQREIDDAVRRRTDLDTPAGARDFQRFLIGKLGEIESVLQTANLDDSSYRALMTAWKSLYSADRKPAEPPPDPSPTPPDPPQPARQPDPEFDPAEYASPLPDPPAPPPVPVAPAGEPPPAMTLPPGLGLGGLPSPLSSPTPGGVPLADLLARPGDGPDPHHRRSEQAGDPQPDLDDESGYCDDPADPAEATTGDDPGPAEPAVVTLPDGTTVSVANPRLAAVIEAAARGTPIPEAFRQQGIIIPPPGSAVPNPIDPTLVAPGDIGMFTDRHALSVGAGKAMLDGQMQQISAVAGPSFLGWEHPPEPGTATVPPRTDAPAPTRPATVDG